MSDQTYLDKYLRSGSPWRIVLGIVGIIALWMGSGLLFPHEEEGATTKHKGLLEKIEIKHSLAEERSSYIKLNGVTEPKNMAKINAEVAGKVIKIIAKDGEFLKKGDPILLIAERDHKEKLEQAKANLAQKKISFDSVEAVFKKGLSSKNAFAEAQAQLKTAESQLMQATIELQNTIVRAPFDGNVDYIEAHVGDFLNINSPVANFVALDQIVVVAYLSEKDITRINLSKPVLVALNHRPLLTAKVNFISSIGDKNTRSFRLEAVLDSKGVKVLSGEAAEVKVPTDLEKLHKLPLMSLNISGDGLLEVKTVVDEKTVKSYPVELVEEEADGIWVRGLPEKADVILLGQSFVVDGKSVDS